MAGENVEHEIGAAGAIGKCFGAGCLYRLQPVLQHRREHLDDLLVAIGVGRQPGSHAIQGVGQLPALEGGAVPQRTAMAFG